MNELLAYVKANRLWFGLGALFLALIVAFVLGVRTAKAEAPAECKTVQQVIDTMAAPPPPVLKPAKILTGASADAVVKAFGADFAASHVLLFVDGDAVLVVAFVGGCFRGAINMPRSVFAERAPGILSETM